MNIYWKELSDKMHERENIQRRKSPAKILNINFYLKVASVAAIIIVLAGVYLFKMNTNNNVKTNYGQIKEKVLPDSSLVILNANSKIITKDFKAGHTR